MTFGESLRAARKAAGKSQGDIATALGVTAAYVSEVERDGRGALTVPRIEELRALGLDVGPMLQAAIEYRAGDYVRALGKTS